MAKLLFIFLVTSSLAGCLVVPMSPPTSRATFIISSDSVESLDIAVDRVSTVLSDAGFVEDRYDAIRDGKRIYQYKLKEVTVRIDSSGLRYEPGYFRVDFHQRGEPVFTEDAIRLYQSINQSFSDANLSPARDMIPKLRLPSVDNTPREFNENQKLPPLVTNVLYWLGKYFGYVVYFAVFIVPILTVLLKTRIRYSDCSTIGRIKVTSCTALIFSPVPVQILLFGPAPLLPSAVAIPLAIGHPIESWTPMVASIVFTFFFSLAASFGVRKS